MSADFHRAAATILEELHACLGRVDEQQAEELIESICGAKKVFVVGVGRVMLMLQAFVKRLNHIGIEAYYVGEINEPAITAYDLLIVASGSGESVVPVAIAARAKAFEPKIAYIGSIPGSAAAAMSDIILRLVGIGNEHYRDEFGVVFDRSHDKDIGVIHDFVIPEPDESLIALPAVDADAVQKRLTAFMNDGRDAFKFAKIESALFERARSLCGFENTFLYLLTEPNFMKALLDRITGRSLELIGIAMECGVDGIYFGDDYGAQRGLLFSGELFRDMFLPRWREMFSTVRKAGKISCLHSCGNVADILPNLIDAGLDAYQTVQPEVYDLWALKDRFPELCFYGGISAQRDLPSLMPEQIHTLVRDTVDIMARGGGYIASPTHRVTSDVPVQNVMALINSLRSFRNS